MRGFGGLSGFGSGDLVGQEVPFSLPSSLYKPNSPYSRFHLSFPLPHRTLNPKPLYTKEPRRSHPASHDLLRHHRVILGLVWDNGK